MCGRKNQRACRGVLMYNLPFRMAKTEIPADIPALPRWSVGDGNCPLSSPKITVLTAVYNGASFLAEAISNIQSQDFDDWEYIIVDDASTDESKKIVDQAMRLDRRLRLVPRT